VIIDIDACEMKNILT